MRKKTKQILSLALSSAMVITSMNYFPVTVNAATQDEYEAWLTTKRNLAYQQTATRSNEREGTNEALVDGVCNEWDNKGGITVNPIEGHATGYFDIDLGKVYSAESIDEVVVWWRTGDANFYPSNGYKIQFSAGSVFNTVAEVTAADFPEDKNAEWGDGAQYMVPITLDKSKLTGNVQTVRIYIDSTVPYGAQAAEIAVFSENPQEGVELEPCADAAGVTVSSNDYNAVTFNITAGENQEGYRYNVYLDGEKEIATQVKAGEDITVSDVAAGTHTIKVVSLFEGRTSVGITSDAVTVTDVSSLISSVRNVVSKLNNEDAEIISVESFYDGHDLTTAQVAIDGDFSVAGEGSNVALRTGAGAAADSFPQSIVIDLGKNYKASEFDKFLIAYSNPRTYASDYSIAFSMDNTTYTEVASGNGLKCGTDNTSPAFVNTVDLDNVSAYSETGVRYVKVTLSKGAHEWGYVVNEMALTVNTDNPTILAGVEVPEAAEVTVTSPSYNTIKTTIAGADGDYTYNIFVDGVKVESNVPAGTYTTTSVDAGVHTVKVRTVDADGNQSTGIEKEVTVEAQFTYTRGEKDDTFADTDENGYNYVKYIGVTASASSGDASQAIDSNAGTRWESEHGVDPQTFTVDLGKVYNVKEIAMTWEGANAKNYTVEVSTDGTDWSTVATVKNQAEGARLDTIVLKDTVEAQYVRVNGTARNLTYGYSIYEIAIYGPDEQEVENYLDVVGYQMNTDTAGIAANSPSFRIISGVSKAYKAADGSVQNVVSYGTVYALSEQMKNPDDAVIGAENVLYTEATEAGKVAAGWKPSDDASSDNYYYVLSFRNNGISADALTKEYVVRAYATLANGEVVYGKAYTTSIYDIAQDLYEGNLMKNETAHNYLYNNVLNVVSIANNRYTVIGKLIETLGVTDKESAEYETCKNVYDTLGTYANKTYVRNGRPDFSSLTTTVDGKSISEWLEDSGLYYTEKAFSGNNLYQ